MSPHAYLLALNIFSLSLTLAMMGITVVSASFRPSAARSAVLTLMMLAFIIRIVVLFVTSVVMQSNHGF